MQYQISSDNMDLTPSMEQLTRDKFSKVESRLANFPDDTKFVRVVLNKSKGVEEKFSVKATVSASGKEYFSDEEEYSLESAILRTVEEILRMMQKDKH